ncbi:MAG: hypothetical protein J6T44_01280 [Prevotella sp.]|nr:hypothetical protein [Prevotella sp.]
MKKIILSFIVLLSVGSAYGQTAEKLMEKYKALEGAQYENTTEESRKSIEENKAGLSQKDYAYALKHFKKSEQVQLTLDDDQKKQLGKDLQSLRGYEMLFVLNDNKGPEEGKNILQNMINQTFSPDYQFRVYGKVKGDVVNDMLIRFDMWDKVVLLHHIGKIKKDFILKGLYNDNMVQVEEDEDAVNMKDVVNEVKNGNALIVINGDEHPELRSLDEAKEYMEKKNFHFNHESWVVGSAVKEKYPNTDKKVVIEFSRQEKEQK